MKRRGRGALAAWVAAGLWLQSCVSGATGTPTTEALHPLDGAQLFATAASFAGRGDDVRAEQYFNAARHAHHPDALVLPALIALCVRASRLRAAMSYALEGLRRQPSDFRLGFLVANLHAALDQPADALRMLEQLVRLRPGWPDAHHLRARLYRDSLGDYASASAAFRAYLQHAPAGPHRQEARAFLAVHPTPRARPASKGRR